MKKPKKLNLVVSRAGSKSSLVNKIFEKLPASLPWGDKQVAYVDPFLGSGVVAMNLHSLFDDKLVYTLNDVEQDLLNVFLAARQFPDELAAGINGFALHSQALHNRFVNLLATDAGTIVERAVAYICSSFTTNVLLAGRKYEAVTANHDLCGRITCLPGSERLQALLAVCRRAHISCADAFDFLHSVRADLRDGRCTFLFADPPYVSTKPHTSDSSYLEWSRGDLRRLQALLDTLTIPWMLTHFPDTELEAWAAERGHTVTEIAKNKNASAMAGKCTSRRNKTEIFITNYSEFWAPEGGWEK